MTDREVVALIKQVAWSLHARCSLEWDDMIGAGGLGYAQALKDFNGQKGMRFRTYAGNKIRWAILDEARRGHGLINNGGSSIPRVRRVAQFVPLDDMQDVAGPCNTAKDVEMRSLRAHVQPCVDIMPKQKQEFVKLFFDEMLTAKEISVVFGCTESRVSQIKKSVIHAMRQWFGEGDT